MADPYSPLTPLSSGEDRKTREKSNIPLTLKQNSILFIREGTFTFFIISGYLFFSFCGFYMYLYKMYIAKKITQAHINTPVNVRFSFL